MVTAALVGLIDRRDRVLLQERDELAPVDPDLWSLPGGAVEEGESPLEGAHRELREETGIVDHDLRPLGMRTLPCVVHRSDDFHLFTARTDVPDERVECNEGRQMVFVDLADLGALDLTAATHVLLPVVLAAHGLSAALPGADQVPINRLRRDPRRRSGRTGTPAHRPADPGRAEGGTSAPPTG